MVPGGYLTNIYSCEKVLVWVTAVAVVSEKALCLIYLKIGNVKKLDSPGISAWVLTAR